MSIVKLGYFLIGLGSGVLASSFVLTHEFQKPIGEIEEFIPNEEGESDFTKDSGNNPEDGQESSWSNSQVGNGERGERQSRTESRRDFRTSDDNDGEEAHAEFSSNNVDVLDYYTSADGNARNGKVQKDKNRQPLRKKPQVDYNKMFKSNQAQIDGGMDDILHAVSSKTGSKDSYDTGGSPTDDIPEGDSRIYDDYTLERVEDGFEIFIGDYPYEFETLTYYAGDTTLATDEDEMIPNPEDYIGTVAINRLVKGGPECPDEVIFVRNVKTGMNYEVMLDTGCYSQIVLGIDPSDRLNDGGGFGGSNK